ncbi:multicopper oxidase family protein [Longimicrobium sp.]|uniref:multicopper oxidase family protein n=1 Tax=Longimicrobium sp. TaxID=2029185 RepID=UPI002CAE50C3|nr:multicopper oxidase family protein [Longimicrobium sp.]HSU17661.1 multicopper oxidase family protein [Longimicrobium sp.]
METRTAPPAPGPAAPPRRRRALPFLAAAGAAAALLAAAASSGSAGPAPRGVPGPSPRDTGVATGGWREPDSVKSVGGVLDVTMAVVKRTVHVPLDSATTQQLMMYRLLSANGAQVNRPASYPGPTFIVNPGDRVRINLIDSLGASDNDHCMSYPAANAGRDTMQDCFHGPTYTNMHFHGFHVTPADSGDNVLLEIAPGQNFQYSFRIPQNQSPGTHWYHPHKHGSVALQVSNAMSGAFIVRQPAYGLDSLTAANHIREVLAAVQQVDTMMNLIDAGLSASTTVNGLGAAQIPIRPGEVIRLRLVNENISNSAEFKIFFSSSTNLPQFYDIARDGVQYDNANYDPAHPDTALWIYPGNRLDMFVKAPNVSRGTFELRVQSVRTERGSRKVRVLRQTRILQAPGRIASFRIVAPNPGDTYATQLPQQLPPLPGFLANVGATRDTAYVVFNDTAYANRSKQTPTQFYLGTVANPYMRFNDTSLYIPVNAGGTQLPMVLGDSQTWIIQNRGTSKNHPFHIHINPFQIMRVEYGPTDPFAPYYAFLNTAAAGGHPVWSDVVPLPLPFTPIGGPTRPGVVTIRQRYDDFDGCQDCGTPWGKFVMHCHILGHEERGMMQLIGIFPSLTESRSFLQAHPAPVLRGLAPPPARGGARPRSGPGSGTGGGNGMGPGTGTGGGHGDGPGGGHHQHP